MTSRSRDDDADILEVAEEHMVDCGGDWKPSVVSVLIDIGRSLDTDFNALLKHRLEAGREEFGAWDVTDGRKYRDEAAQEIADAVHYLCADILRRRIQSNT